MGRAILFGAAALLLVASNASAQTLDFRAVATGGPSASGASMAYDAANARPMMLLPGGTYGWDGTGWSLTTSAFLPAAGSGWYGIVRDVDRGVVLYAGPYGTTGSLTRFFEWSGSAWAERTPGGWAEATSVRALVSIPSYGVLLLPLGNAPYVWAGSPPSATQLTSSGWSTSFSPTSAAYDAVRGVAVVVGTLGADPFVTYEFTAPGPFVQRSVASEPPAATGSLVWDATRSKMVFLGGDFSGGVYEWSGTAWTRTSVATVPPARTAAPAAAHDPGAGRVLMLGGATDTATWSLRTYLALGATCSADAGCASGHCVDGVCCNTTCGGGATDDCQACSVATGATTNGTCAPRASSQVCRASAGICDVADRCDGVSTACPVDVRAPTGQPCRPVAGLCDVAEACDGAAVDCPGDAYLGSGVVCRPLAGLCDVAESCSGASRDCPADGFAAGGTCRPSAGACDPSETCDGTQSSCPADVLAPTGQSCRPAVGPCDIGDFCTGASASCDDLRVSDGTACDDGLACTVLSACQTGLCQPSTTIVCVDSDPCTTDVCMEPVGCMFTPVPACLDAGMGGDAGPDAGRDAGPSDAGRDASGQDASQQDASEDVDASGSVPVTASGCSCRVADARPDRGRPMPLGIVGVVGFAVLARARRRTRRRPVA